MYTWAVPTSTETSGGVTVEVDKRDLPFVLPTPNNFLNYYDYLSGGSGTTGTGSIVFDGQYWHMAFNGSAIIEPVSMVLEADHARGSLHRFRAVLRTAIGPSGATEDNGDSSEGGAYPVLTIAGEDSVTPLEQPVGVGNYEITETNIDLSGAYTEGDDLDLSPAPAWAVKWYQTAHEDSGYVTAASAWGCSVEKVFAAFDLRSYLDDQT